MSGSWQLVMIGLIVAGAASYLVRRSWRSWRFPSQGCGGSCGCNARNTQKKSARLKTDFAHFIIFFFFS